MTKEFTLTSPKPAAETIEHGLLAEADAEAANLGRFGHHPDAALDFCIEVEALTGRLHDAKHGISKPGTPAEVVQAVANDIARAMTFKVGGDEGAIYAKHCLRKLEDEAKAALKLAAGEIVLVPAIPTEAQWGGLARDIIQWWCMSRPSGQALHEHLHNLGRAVPDWLVQEIPRTSNVPAKGDVAAAIYRAMLAAASIASPVRTDADGELRRALDECWENLVEKDDRTSPDDYPDHALITREELGGYLTLAARVATLPPNGDEALAPHPDDEAVDRWAVAMKAKLAEARAKGRGGWDDPMRCSPEQLTLMLREHVEKGDPLDVANFAMMIHQRGLRILPPSRWADDCIAKSVEVLERHENDELDRIENWTEYAEAIACVLGELQNRLRQDIRCPDRFRHRETGGIYEVIGLAQIQASPDQPLVDYDRVVLYRSTYRGDRPYTGGELRGDLWARREAEFHDGRFEPVPRDDCPKTELPS